MRFQRNGYKILARSRIAVQGLTRDDSAVGVVRVERRQQNRRLGDDVSQGVVHPFDVERAIDLDDRAYAIRIGYATLPKVSDALLLE